jgi:putative restriction endonuclease
LWSRSNLTTNKLQDLIKAHESAVKSAVISHKAVEKIAQDIESYFGDSGDILQRAMIDVTGMAVVSDVTTVIDATTDEEWKTMEDDDTSKFESALDQVRKWRQVADRGVGGRVFSERVKSAYNFRCLFSGSRLPPLLDRKSGGVDSAHILPWAQHQLNSVTNGICLNKLCHWAFDSGIVKLDVEDSKYYLTVPDLVKEAATTALFDLDYFLKLEGQIDDKLLPFDKSKWPKPEFIKKLNEAMFPL